MQLVFLLTCPITRTQHKFLLCTGQPARLARVYFRLNPVAMTTPGARRNVPFLTLARLEDFRSQSIHPREPHNATSDLPWLISLLLFSPTVRWTSRLLTNAVPAHMMVMVWMASLTIRRTRTKFCGPGTLAISPLAHIQAPTNRPRLQPTKSSTVMCRVALAFLVLF